MTFLLPELPFNRDALAPHISEETINYHYGKHHQTYVDKLNVLVKETDYESKTLEQIIESSSGPIFNNAAQVWNHTFYWNCLSPNAESQPEGGLLESIDNHFSSFSNFKKVFTDKAINNFGSGWTWLVKKNDQTLAIINTSNAETPLTEGHTPLLTCDVWEHAYYVDYRNARPKYLDAFWKVVSWKNVAENFSQ